MIAWRITAIVLSIGGAVLIPGVCAGGAPTVENIRFSNGDITWAGEGEFDDNGRLMNGKGIYKWANGDIFDGQIVDGMIHGEGKMSYKDGIEYSGGWFKGKWHGEGTLKGKEGSVYSGQFVDGMMHGKGVIKRVNGVTYDGEWLDNMPHGEGKMTYKDGSEYSGGWFKAKWHGVGTLKGKEGDVYSGQRKDGVAHGKGVYKWANGETYDGEWLDNMPHGEGKMTYQDGIEYSGGWFKSKRHGKGTFKWPEGNVYSGEWLADVQQGEGELKYKDGSQYVGEWLVGTRHGFGVYTSMWNFYQYKGGWSNDKRHGKGVKSYFWHFVECEEEWDHGKMRGVRTCRFLFLQTLVEDTWHYHYLCLGVVLWWMFRIHKELADVKATASWSRCNIEKLKHDERRDDDDLVVRLDQDHIHCGICYEAFTSDMESTDQNSREKLPVLGSCGHYFCHGCIIRCRTMVGPNGSVGCPKCMKANQFVRGNPIHHRMLIDLLERALPVENLRMGQ